MGSFGEYIDVRSIVISGITSAATSFLAVGAGVIVNSAFADLADDSIKLFANGVADAIIGGNASLLSTGIDWITQRVAKGGELK